MSRRLAWVGIAPIAIYLVFIGGSWSGIYQPTLRFPSVLLAGLVLGVWAVVCVHRPDLRPRSVLMPAVAISIGSLALSTAFSRFPAISVEYLGYAIVLAALYLLLVQLLRDEFFRRRFVVLAGGLFPVLVVAYLALVFGHWVDWWEALGRVTVPPLRPEFESLTFGNPSAVLTIVALLGVPLVATSEWATRRDLVRVAAVLAAITLVALLTGSRAGWLALGLAGLLSLGLLAANPTGRGTAWRFFAERTRTRAGRSVAVASAVAIVVMAVALAPTIIRRATEGGEANRLVFAQVALRLFAESPIVGTGPGSWVIQRTAETMAGEPDEYIPHAHNLYAQTLGELGLAGALAGLVLVILLARLIARATRSTDPARRRWGWATLIALAYFAAHQVLDFYANFPTVLFLAALPVAYLDATDERAPRSVQPAGRSGRVLAGAAAAVVALAIAGLLLQEVPALRAAAAVDRANAGDWAAADADARTAASQDPRISSYLLTAGLTAARAGDHAAAIGYFRTVAERDDLSEAWLNLAAEELEVGETAAVEPAIRAALRLGSARPSIAISGGELALRAGLRELGMETLVNAVAAAPSFMADPWWQRSPSVAGLQAEIAGRAAAAAPNSAWEIALMSGDPDRARSLLSGGDGDELARAFVAAWAGDDAARVRLWDRCDANPFDVVGLGLCARLATHRGDAELATRFRLLASSVSLYAARLGTELRVVEDPNDATIDVDLALWWGPFTYRRYVPWDMLVPSLVHLTRR